VGTKHAEYVKRRRRRKTFIPRDANVLHVIMLNEKKHPVLMVTSMKGLFVWMLGLTKWIRRTIG
jgi:hypothetical protein